VVGELIPHGFVGLPRGELAKRATIDPGHYPSVDDDVIDELGEHIVPAAHGHILCECHEVGVGWLAIVEVDPDLVVRPIEAAVEVPQHDERCWALGRRVDPTLEDRHLRQHCLAGRAGRGVLETAALQMHRHHLNRLAVARQVDAGAIAQAAIAANVQRLEVRLPHDREPALDREAGILLAVQRSFGPVVDVHVIDLGIHHPTERRLAIDLLDGEDIWLKKPHVAPDAVVIRDRAFHRRVCPGIGRLAILGLEVLQVPGGEP
jgi:hypothetical protein